MNYETVLLIGGPHDGQWISVLSGVSDVVMHERKRASLLITDEIPANIPLKRISYHRHPMHSSQGLKTAVYVFEGVDALAALIEWYRKP